MKKIGVVLTICILVLFSFNVQAQQAMDAKTSNPRVISTFPQSGDMAVDPTINEIKVTFSEDMKTENMWSWVMSSEETFPEIVGDVQYLADKRTCVAPVKLESGKTYVIWFNSDKYNAFRDLDNNPSIPFLLEFKTK